MKVELLAFDSMGVRSMCTFVETADLKITIDPGISLAPKRFNLPPHQIELDRLHELAGGIRTRAAESDVLVITHYHYDHHDLGDTIPLDVYKGKTVLVKDPRNNVNQSQGDFRAPLFIGMLKERAKSVESGDGKRFLFGNTEIEFSKAVFHGASSLLGYVIEVKVGSDGRSLVHSSDVQGPIYQDQTEFMIASKPDLAIVDGPMIYMLDHRYTRENLASSMNNLRLLLGNGLKELVIDHHFLRDLKYIEYMNLLKQEFPESSILTAAEYMSKKNDLLEARRRELYSHS